MSPLTTSLAISLALLTGAQTGLQAQAPALDAWARVDVLRPGTTIVVTLTTGERRDCRFVRSTADDLTLAFPDASEETLPKSLFTKVAGTTLVRDSTGNGAAIGAAVGALAGLALVSYVYARYPEMTTKSEIAKKLQTELARAREREARRVGVLDPSVVVAVPAVVEAIVKSGVLAGVEAELEMERSE